MRCVLSCVLIAAGALVAGGAQAQQACVPIAAPPAGDAALFDVEGPISAYDRAARTMTANGLTFQLPAGLLVATASLDGPGNLPFETLTDPALEAQRSIIGGTAIASGTASAVPGPNGELCLTLIVSSIFVEFAENVVVGVVHDVDLAAGTLRVAGALVKMNQDPRFPSRILSADGLDIDLAVLAGFEGTLATVEGYFDAADGLLWGVTLETEALIGPPGADSIAIIRAQGRSDRNELRVDGQVGPTAAGQVATSVDIYTGAANALGTACVGTLLGTATVDVVDFTFRQRNLSSLPSQVCAQSPLGSASSHVVEIQ